MLAVNVLAAGTDAEARRLFSSIQQVFINLRRGAPGPLPPPIDDIESLYSPAELAGLESALACSFVGTPDTIRGGLKSFIQATGTDELIITGHIFDHAARVRSFELVAQVREELSAERGAA
jgi:alkanesulfonate monooxygenase SsuD/methylene tetrahydromethanopterin reductase-like flavin-dependent oxidoreductase (luciferase family)